MRSSCKAYRLAIRFSLGHAQDPHAPQLNLRWERSLKDFPLKVPGSSRGLFKGANFAFFSEKVPGSTKSAWEPGSQVPHFIDICALGCPLSKLLVSCLWGQTSMYSGNCGFLKRRRFSIIINALSLDLVLDLVC